MSNPLWGVIGEWVLNVAKAVAMFAAFAIVWSLRNAFIAGWNVHKFINDYLQYKKDNDKEVAQLRTDFKEDVANLKELIKKNEQRLDRAGEEMSNIASDVQGMPERLRSDFVPRREVELQFAENKVDRELLRQEVNNIWKRISERDERRRR